MIRSENSMIHPRPGPIGLNSINTIETKVRMETVTERMRHIKTDESKDLNLRPKTKEEEKKAENPKEMDNRGQAAEPMLALRLIKDLKAPSIFLEQHAVLEQNAGGTIDYVG